MSSITLVSPPDILINNQLSILLVHPDNWLKAKFQDMLTEIDESITVYLYEVPVELEDIDWVLTMQQSADYTIIDIDNSCLGVRTLASFMLSQSNTFWLTKSGGMYYNKINANRIYDLDIIKKQIGEHLERQKQR